MIKKLKTFSLVFLLTGFQLLLAQSKSYVIEGQLINSGKISKLYFTTASINSSEQAPIKEIKVIGDKFKIEGTLQEPLSAWISTDPNLDNKVFYWLLDFGQSKLIYSSEDRLSSSIKGSTLYDDLQFMVSQQKAFSASMVKINNTFQENQKNGVAVDSLALQFNRVADDWLATRKRFVQEHPNSFMSILLLKELAFSDPAKDYNYIDSALDKLSSSLKSTPSAKFLKQKVSDLKRLIIGAMAPDFTQNTPEGKPLSLSSFRGKYVLVDFWASWCGPCRQENPNLVVAYQQFKDKGFTVLGVSLDRSHDNWLKAIQDDKLTWSHVSDLKYWSNEVAEQYGISSVPANFLIDPNGKIVARDLRGEDLVNKLAEILR